MANKNLQSIRPTDEQANGSFCTFPRSHLVLASGGLFPPLGGLFPPSGGLFPLSGGLFPPSG